MIVHIDHHLSINGPVQLDQTNGKPGNWFLGDDNRPVTEHPAASLDGRSGSDLPHMIGDELSRQGVHAVAFG